VKRLENFWKGLSDNRSQISPIPPQAYGDRFINFVTGITMTKEEAERRQGQSHETARSEVASTIPGMRSRQNSRGAQIGVDVDGTRAALSQSDKERFNRDKSPPGSPVAVERTMAKAQKQVNKETGEKGRRRSEEDKPSRTLLTAEDDRAILPVVSEENGGESSAGSRNRSRDDGAAAIGGYEVNEKPTTMDTGIRIVSASTKRDSQEEQHDDVREMDEEFEREKAQRAKPPRLDSGILPKFSPIDEAGSAWGMDPEKR
jgi:hypothetical protein